MAAMAAAAAAMASASASSALLSITTSGASPTSALMPALALPRRGRAPAYGVPGAAQHRRRARGPSALFGGGEKGTGEGEKKPEKKFITKEEEPEQYWASASEREGKNPMETLLPYIFILTLLTPFAILAVAYTQGWIKTPN